jgi:protein O-mannosyl-transferase
MRERLLLACAALAAFGLSLGSGFHFDDYAIFADRALTGAGGWLEVWRAGQTRPLTYLTFWLNFQLGGRDPVGWHAVNLALHVGAVLLLYDCLRRTTPGMAALVGAAIFAVHPVQTEAVAYVWARSILLATVFCLLCWRSWMAGRTWHAAAWFAAALLSKEECAAFPLVLAMLEGKRWRAAAGMMGLSIAAAARVVYAAAVTPGAPIAQQAGIAPLDYLLAQGPVVLRYLRLIVMPWGFTVDPDVAVPPAWWGIAAWAGVAAVAAMAWKWNRWVLAGLVLLLPSSSIFPVADLAADRRLYLPMVGLAAGAGWLLARVRPRAAAAAACVGLAAVSVARTEVWMTEERLWRDAVKKAPGKLRPKLQLARAVPPAEALPILAGAKRLAPEDPAVAAQTGSVLMAAGRPGEALGEFGRALALAPRDARQVNNRGTALEALGQVEAAREDYRRALAMDPSLEAARENLRRVGN